MAKTTIAWAHYTFNPWIGCSKVDELCANCYAEGMDKLRKWTPSGWGKGKPRQRTSEATWKNPLKWNREAGLIADGWNTFRDQLGTTDERLIQNGHEKPEPPRVFCASLADWLDDEVPHQWRFELFELIYRTPNLNWLLLTKRPENFVRLMKGARDSATVDFNDVTDRIDAWLSGESLPFRNIWIGASVGTQKSASIRIPEVMKIPAVVRFLSCEPMLEQVDFGFLGTVPKDIQANYTLTHEMIHWVIFGCESKGTHVGRNADMVNTHILNGVKQCKQAGVKAFVKQLNIGRKASEDITMFPKELQIRELP